MEYKSKCPVDPRIREALKVGRKMSEFISGLKCPVAQELSTSWKNLEQDCPELKTYTFCQDCKCVKSGSCCKENSK